MNSEEVLSKKHDWYTLPIEAIYHIFRTKETGLKFEEAAERLVNYGPNCLPSIKKELGMHVFFHISTIFSFTLC